MNNAPDGGGGARVRAVSLGAMLVALAACGTEASAPPPSADASADAARDAASDAASDAAKDAPPDDVPPETLVWRRCYRTFFCADVSVPYDWSRPSGPRATVGVLRAPARVPAERVGVLMLNYGGPGAPTEELVAQSYPTVLGPAIGPVVADLFDVVAIDWRGLGRSQPSLACGVVRTHDPLSEPDGVVESDEGWAAMVAEQMRIRRACTERVPAEFLARVSSDDAARDMDHVRALLGEERVNYVGYSYGTRLGASYMALFPGRVRAFVLDSPIAPGLDLRALIRAQARGFDTALDRFSAWCAASTACDFRGGDSEGAAVRRRFTALVAAMERAPYSVGKRRVTGSVPEAALVRSAYAPADAWRPFATALAAAAQGDASGLVRFVDGGWSDDQFVSGFLSIMALDYPAAEGETVEGLRAFLRTEIAPSAPHTVRLFAIDAVRIGWPARRPSPAASVRAPSAPPALVIGSRYDPPTPYEWATAMRDALGNGSHLVTYEGDGHTNSGRVPCLGGMVIEYLQDPSSPPPDQSCASLDP